ncbi:hypothetical protein [Pedobacter cryoconitis]|uniref:Lipoprotein n=1 Tax=Pedobacter cryoconitis TaxID=188932 RepID=A0A7X0J8N0_9SPHI|nr:hypothetical protein [Pedobacter cryoconitis]MBB6501912.1 hypothetical protein [Pedobacter cryoconitis]
MKKNIFTSSVLILSLAISLIFSSCKGHGDRLKITVNETDTNYEMTASYNEDKTPKVEQYLSQYVPQTAIFKPGHPSEIRVTLADKSEFNIKSTPGELRINLDKKLNTKTSLNNIKRISKELKDILQ